MKRPLIIITISYILFIIILDLFGVLYRIPAGDIANQATGNKAIITGRIIDEPEQTENRTHFTIKAISINSINTKGNVLVNDYAGENLFSYGDIVEVTGNFFKPKPPSTPGVFDYRKYLFRKRIYSIISAPRQSSIRITGSNPSFFLRFPLKLRQRILNTYEKYLQPEQAAVLSGITVGEKSGLTPYLKKIFVDAGVMYVLVISGLHVTFVASAFYWLFRSIFRLKRKIAICLFIPVLLTYTIITGANPPVLRAAIMTIIVISAMLLNRNVDIYQGIFLAALIVLIYNPLTLFDAGFQMSFITTFGILYFFPKLQLALKFNKSRKLLYLISCLFFASFSAQITIAPLLAFYFNKVSIIAPISNLIILPTVGFAIDAGLLLYFVSLTGTHLTLVAAKLTGWLISFITYLVNMFANIPHSTIRTATPPIIFIILFYLIIFGLPRMKNYAWKRVVIFSFAVLILFPIFTHLLRNKKNLEISFLNVGLGDAVYCEFPDGSNMLIDGGGSWKAKYDTGENIVCPFLWNKGITAIDTVILTHPHTNHYQGLISVCNNIKIRRFITNCDTSDEIGYQELMGILRKNEVPIETISAGENIKIGSVTIDVLNPEIISSNADDNSLVMKLCYNDFSVLLCGDITRKTQSVLSSGNICTTVLLVPSHGKKELLSDFLLNISPKYAIMSTDKPAETVLKQLHRYRSFSTSVSGTLTIWTDGNAVEVKQTLKEPLKL